MHRSEIFPLMSVQGQNPKLPHRNIDGRFTSISRHQRHDGGRGHRQHEHEYGDESDAKLSDCSKARSRPSQLGRIASATTASSGAKPSEKQCILQLKLLDEPAAHFGVIPHGCSVTASRW